MKRIVLAVLVGLVTTLGLVLPLGTAAAATQPLVITTSAMPTLYHGYSTSTQLAATGGTKGLFGYSWSVVAGNLPLGLKLSKAGRLAGTVQRDGLWPVYRYEFTVQVTDSQGVSATRDFEAVITPMRITSPEVLPAGKKGRYYSYTMKHLGGCQRVGKWAIYGPDGISYSLNGVGAEYLPTGLKLVRSSGVIAGVPKAPGTYDFYVEALCQPTHPFSLFDRGHFSITIS